MVMRMVIEAEASLRWSDVSGCGCDMVWPCCVNGGCDVSCGCVNSCGIGACGNDGCKRIGIMGCYGAGGCSDLGGFIHLLSPPSSI